MEMARYSVEVIWVRGDQNFLDQRYSRRHLLRFDGGIEVAGTSSPHVVPLPLSDPAAVDPEETFVASLSSCHMLWFLSIAAKRGFRIDRYRDNAVGSMRKNADGKLAVTRVTLPPEVAFSGELLPTREQIDAMHHEAHEACYIANSVQSAVGCEPVYHLIPV
jgi:organic hydroperoxide reductase OsmC/OhrA